jgi:hypothetical protein
MEADAIDPYARDRHQHASDYPANYHDVLTLSYRPAQIRYCPMSNWRTFPRQWVKREQTSGVNWNLRKKTHSLLHRDVAEQASLIHIRSAHALLPSLTRVGRTVIHAWNFQQPARESVLIRNTVRYFALASTS